MQEGNKMTTWLEKEVEVYFTPIDDPPQTVLDIGANIGAFTKKAHDLWPNAIFTCYEAMPQLMDELNANCPFALNSNKAVLNYDGKCNIYVGDCLTTSSFYKLGRQLEYTIEIDCIAASGILSHELVKIDTEGCETDIIMGLDLSNTRHVWLEYHLPDDKIMLTTFMQVRGFTVVKHVPDEKNSFLGTLCFTKSFTKTGH